ncbi:unnamed protein product [Vitrella brassicaformis CCMP3155]|uniref:NOT2/NOT3/NOT5 C-terminal domain-containing protein n=3 Tax=Vitrella brassicaformis TaxID=1169539 RepID=A0A0G4ENE1_VITBC|nr:unnamed protein product [Vitrella brassicaformis CCMP3155]|eukprot:CEL98517.1 unnamed protein product [Vitrella brassicaformis CCMP3155]
MAAKKKQAAEIEVCLKKVDEGLAEFSDTWGKVEAARNQDHKETLQNKLKQELKKLQRHRDDIKKWLEQDSTRSKKDDLLEARKKIEKEMERFRELEKHFKMKTYSKEGLEQTPKMDQKDIEKQDKIAKIEELSHRLSLLKEQVEADLEKESSKGGKKKGPDANVLGALQGTIDRYEGHIHNLDQMVRRIHNDSFDLEAVENIVDSLVMWLDEVDDDTIDDDKVIAYQQALEDLYDENQLTAFNEGAEDMQDDADESENASGLSGSPAPEPSEPAKDDPTPKNSKLAKLGRPVPPGANPGVSVLKRDAKRPSLISSSHSEEHPETPMSSSKAASPLPAAAAAKDKHDKDKDKERDRDKGATGRERPAERAAPTLSKAGSGSSWGAVDSDANHSVATPVASGGGGCGGGTKRPPPADDAKIAPSQISPKPEGLNGTSPASSATSPGPQPVAATPPSRLQQPNHVSRLTINGTRPSSDRGASPPSIRGGTTATTANGVGKRGAEPAAASGKEPPEGDSGTTAAASPPTTAAIGQVDRAKRQAVYKPTMAAKAPSATTASPRALSTANGPAMGVSDTDTSTPAAGSSPLLNPSASSLPSSSSPKSKTDPPAAAHVVQASSPRVANDATQSADAPAPAARTQPSEVDHVGRSAQQQKLPPSVRNPPPPYPPPRPQRLSRDVGREDSKPTDGDGGKGGGGGGGASTGKGPIPSLAHVRIRRSKGLSLHERLQQTLAVLEASMKDAPKGDERHHQLSEHVYHPEQPIPGPLQPSLVQLRFPVEPSQLSDSYDYFERVLSDDTLLFIFAYHRGKLQQSMAAYALEKRNWRWNSQLGCWLQPGSGSASSGGDKTLRSDPSVQSSVAGASSTSTSSFQPHPHPHPHHASPLFGNGRTDYDYESSPMERFDTADWCLKPMQEPFAYTDLPPHQQIRVPPNNSSPSPRAASGRR